MPKLFRLIFFALPMVFTVLVILALWGVGYIAKIGGLDFCLGFLSGAGLYMVWVRIEKGEWI